ncbi:MAG: hypothetical protein HY070_10415 [Chloroflexi bacterium]|nr:hypothetical protein [Chloroflexota bacterium]
MKPIVVEVLAYAPTAYFHCQHCEIVFDQYDVKGVKKFHQEAVQSSIPEDMMKEYNQLSDWVMAAVERFGGRVVFKVIDAASVEGLLKSVRYGVRKYPAVVIEGKEKQVGTDFQRAETLIKKNLATVAA